MSEHFLRRQVYGRSIEYRRNCPRSWCIRCSPAVRIPTGHGVENLGLSAISQKNSLLQCNRKRPVICCMSTEQLRRRFSASDFSIDFEMKYVSSGGWKQSCLSRSDSTNTGFKSWNRSNWMIPLANSRRSWTNSVIGYALEGCGLSEWKRAYIFSSPLICPNQKSKSEPKPL